MDIKFILLVSLFFVIAYLIVYWWLPKKGFFKIEGEEEIFKYKKREANFKGFMCGVIAFIIANFIQAFIFGIESKWFPTTVALITAFVVRQKLSEK